MGRPERSAPDDRARDRPRRLRPPLVERESRVPRARRVTRPARGGLHKRSAGRASEGSLLPAPGILRDAPLRNSRKILRKRLDLISVFVRIQLRAIEKGERAMKTRLIIGGFVLVGGAALGTQQVASRG